MRRWSVTAIVLAVVTAAPAAHADIAPSPPEACAARPEGSPCYDALGREGRCVAAQWSGGRCSLIAASAAPPKTSTPPATASAEPSAAPQSAPPRSGGCAAAPAPLAGSGVWGLAALVLLARVSRRRRQAGG